MSDYIIAYHGGEPPGSPEEAAAHMSKWKAWVAGLGDAVVNPGTPLKNTRIVSATGVSEGGGPDVMTGFSVISAESLDAALEMAGSCPVLDVGGTLEVAEMMSLPG